MKKKIYFIITLNILLLLSFSIKSYASTSYKTIHIKHYNMKLTSTFKDKPIALPDSKTNIYYYRKSDGRKISIKTVYSDHNGNINNVKVNVPTNITRIYFSHQLIDRKNSMLLDEKGNNITITSSELIKNNAININQVKMIGNKTSYNGNYSYANAWYVYRDMIKDYHDATSFTKRELKNKQHKDVSPFIEKPVKLKYTHSNKMSGLANTYKEDLGKIKKGDFVIRLNLPMLDEQHNQKRLDELHRVYIAHEYAHFTMFQAIGREGMTSYGYQSHSSYNKVPQVSYKEGWGLFHANRFPYRLNMNGNLDVIVQGKDKEILYGKSTNRTVFHVLRDIYDLDNRIEKQNDIYNIAYDNFGKNYTKSQIEQLSNGLMYFSMRDSKATTLEQYIKYLKQHYVHNQTTFNQILKLNGLNTNGQFTLDQYNNRIH